MEFKLSTVEARILGTLIEKQMTTPDYYPLTLNALVNACNQKSNRNPVMSLDENTIIPGLDSLRAQHLVWQVKTQGSRTVKFEHNMKDVFDFSASELAVICLLLLRGPQTSGEIRSRTTRLCEFHGLAAVEHTLEKLAAHEKGPFVVKLPRSPGQKESRYAHLFSDVPQTEPDAPADPISQAPTAQTVDHDRIAILEEQVANLTDTLEALKSEFDNFRKQFE